MAITDFDSYRDMQKNPDFMIPLSKAMISLPAGRLGSLFTANPFRGSDPTTAQALTPSSSGANPYWKNGGSGALRMVAMNFGYYLNHTIIIIDRLSHQGGLSGTVTTPQTTNLPTAALPRYTDGVGVWAGLQIYSALGTTATTFSVSYTNSDGTAGRTSPLSNIGSTSYNAAGIVLPIPLQEGDKGIRSVESVTLTASTVSAAGNFGVVLFKPLMFIPPTQQGAQIEIFDPIINGGVNIPELPDDTFLDFMVMSGATGSSGAFQANLRFAEDR